MPAGAGTPGPAEEVGLAATARYNGTAAGCWDLARRAEGQQESAATPVCNF